MREKRKAYPALRKTADEARDREEKNILLYKRAKKGRHQLPLWRKVALKVETFTGEYGIKEYKFTLDIADRNGVF